MLDLAVVKASNYLSFLCFKIDISVFALLSSLLYFIAPNALLQNERGNFCNYIAVFFATEKGCFLFLKNQKKFHRTDNFSACRHIKSICTWITFFSLKKHLVPSCLYWVPCLFLALKLLLHKHLDQGERLRSQILENKSWV